MPQIWKLEGAEPITQIVKTAETIQQPSKGFDLSQVSTMLRDVREIISEGNKLMQTRLQLAQQGIDVQMPQKASIQSTGLVELPVERKAEPTQTKLETPAQENKFKYTSEQMAEGIYNSIVADLKKKCENPEIGDRKFSEIIMFMEASPELKAEALKIVKTAREEKI